MKDNMNNFGDINNGNEGNCVISIDGKLRHFTLTEEGVDAIELLRTYDEGGRDCHERFFLTLMQDYYHLLEEVEIPDKDEKFSKIFTQAALYSEVLTNIVKTE